MKFDFKITTWERVTVSDNNEAKVLEAIKNGEVTSASDIFNLLADDFEAMVENNVIVGVEEQMSTEDNGGCSTIEVMDDGNITWYNGNTI